MNFDILQANSGGLDLIIDKNNAFLAAEFQGLYILDISDLNNVKVKHQLTQSDFGLSEFSLYSLVKHGNYLYCAFRTTSGGYSGGYLKIVNLTNLDTSGPVIETNDLFFYGAFHLGARVTGLFLNSDSQEIYAALREGGLSVVDISSPANPILKGNFDPGSSEHQEVIVDSDHKRAYFGGWYRGIGYVDISDNDPANWVELFVDDIDANDRYWYLAQRNQYLYATVADAPDDNTFDEGLAIYDLTDNFTDPLEPPVRTGFAAIPAEFQCESATGGKDEGLVGGDPGPHQILLDGDYAIVANGCMGIAIFDISDPHNPFFVKEYEIPGQNDWPWSIAKHGDAVITIGRNKNDSVNNDIYVFQISPVTFSFTEQVDAPLNSQALSNSAIINGLNSSKEISIINGEYSINNAPFTNEPGIVSNNDSIQVRIITSPEHYTKTTATLTIGDISETFNVTTIARMDSVNTEQTGAISLLELLLITFLSPVLYLLRTTSTNNQQ